PPPGPGIKPRSRLAGGFRETPADGARSRFPTSAQHPQCVAVDGRSRGWIPEAPTHRRTHAAGPRRAARVPRRGGAAVTRKAQQNWTGNPYRRPNSPYWHIVFVDADGVTRCRSTKTTDL